MQIKKGGDNESSSTPINFFPLFWYMCSQSSVYGQKNEKKHELNLGHVSMLGIPAPEIL